MAWLDNEYRGASANFGNAPRQLQPTLHRSVPTRKRLLGWPPPHTDQRFNRSISMFEGVIGYIIGGAVIGILARFLKPGADPMGWILTILLGIAGAYLGSQLGVMLNLTSTIMVWVCAIAAAIILLFLYEAVRRKTSKVTA
jgi:uncharacterized membrane protein YeaQ/YmgE (transglycosylase-associated protein family)